MIEKEYIMNGYYFQVEIEQGAYIWSHYQSDKRNFDYDIQLNDIVEEQGRVIGVRYGGTLFSIDEIGVGKIISESKESGGSERYRVERAVLRKKEKQKMSFKDWAEQIETYISVFMEKEDGTEPFFLVRNC